MVGAAKPCYLVAAVSPNSNTRVGYRTFLRKNMLKWLVEEDLVDRNQQETIIALISKAHYFLLLVFCIVNKPIDTCNDYLSGYLLVPNYCSYKLILLYAIV